MSEKIDAGRPGKRDQKIAEWAVSSARLEDARKQWGLIKNPELEPVILAFYENVIRAAQLARLPFELCSFGQQLRLAEMAACQLHFGEPRPSATSVMPSDDEGRKRFAEDYLAIRKLMNGILTGTVAPPFSLSTVVDSEDLTAYAHQYMADQFDTLMSAQLVLAWTAFETMAGDLWETAVNIHPQTLAALKGLLQQGKSEGKALPMSYLERYGYDLRRKMGTILRDHRCRFVSLDDIVTSYRLAFPERGPLNSEAFWDDRDLKSAVAIRNLLVHKAGMVDKEFKDKTGHDDRLKHWTPNSRFRLDGSLSGQLMDGLVGFGFKLIGAVDEWLTANPE